MEKSKNLGMIFRKTVTNDTADKRLDEVVSLLCENVSRSEARRIIDRGGCALNGTMVRVASRVAKAKDIIEVGVMEPGRFQNLQLSDEAILLEDIELVAVNKPAGVNTQRTPYQLKGTMEYWIAEYFRRHGINETVRVIHRLDRGTSGTMLFPKSKRAAAKLSGLFHDGLVTKRYLALTCGVPPAKPWAVNGAIGKIGVGRYGVFTGGRPARTLFRSLAHAGKYSLVEATPLTGRTHQIRVHLAASGLPIVGDLVYGGEAADRMMLHSAILKFGYDADSIKCAVAPLDAAFEACLREKGFAWEYEQWRDTCLNQNFFPENEEEMTPL